MLPLGDETNDVGDMSNLSQTLLYYIYMYLYIYIYICANRRSLLLLVSKGGAFLKAGSIGICPSRTSGPLPARSTKSTPQTRHTHTASVCQTKAWLFKCQTQSSGNRAMRCSATCPASFLTKMAHSHPALAARASRHGAVSAAKPGMLSVVAV